MSAKRSAWRETSVRMAWVYGAAALVALGLGLWGVWRHDPVLAAMGALGLTLVLAVAPVTFATLARNGGGEEVRRAAAEFRAAVERLAELQALSDDARRVLNRGRERELLRSAIEEDIAAGEWEAALVLVRELADRFGYRTDAEEFRARIEAARRDAYERQISAAIAQLDGLIIQRRWEDARAEAGRLGRLYPDSPRVAGLRKRADDAHDRYKEDLERRFLLAARESRVDDAMAMLKELDGYLTEREAEPFREVARGVIGKARENLGVEFKLAVRDRRWGHAARVGERIIAEFPNTRMAEEVRGMIDGLRSRAASVG
ncbi:MAG: hypothetical protein KIS87_08575 [Phycisphaeraceae bacterium]|nr:hypothetical protein [Phycisphaeraceae bacterium]